MTVHLYWDYPKGSDFSESNSSRITRAVTLCGKSLPVGMVTANPLTATCDTCVERYREHQERARDMVKTVNIHDLSGPQLVKAYNEMRATAGHPPIKKFRDLETGRRFVTDAMVMVGSASKVDEILSEVAATATATREEAPAAVSGKEEDSPPVTDKNKEVKKSKKKDGISDADEIEILDLDYGKREKPSATMTRWGKLLALKTKTVGEYRAKIAGDKTIGDVKWWIKHKRISLKA